MTYENNKQTKDDDKDSFEGNSATNCCTSKNISVIS